MIFTFINKLKGSFNSGSPYIIIIILQNNKKITSDINQKGMKTWQGLCETSGELDVNTSGRPILDFEAVCNLHFHTCTTNTLI